MTYAPAPLFAATDWMNFAEAAESCGEFVTDAIEFGEDAVTIYNAAVQAFHYARLVDTSNPWD